MSSEPDDFDVEAAWLRRSQGDLRAFMEALAVRLEGALPQHVSVDRRRDGLLSKTSHVARIEIRNDAAVYVITFIRGVLAATRAKVVRGVVISTAPVAIARWLADVRAEVRKMAEQSGDSADVLHDFL
ncbi:MAG TPA: hypothetical protein VGI79_09705 [Caulobacteraceae bacterium]|jgi:hypothetical protein